MSTFLLYALPLNVYPLCWQLADRSMKFVEGFDEEKKSFIPSIMGLICKIVPEMQDGEGQTCEP